MVVIMETKILNKIHEDLEYVKRKVNLIEQEISVISDIDPEVRLEYLKRLNKIKKEKGIPFKNLGELRNKNVFL